MAEKIALKGLTKRFGSILAVDNISMSVAGGEVMGFLGPNGAGKSTTMRMLTGFIEPTSGTAEICGLDVTRHPVEAKRRIGYLPEGAPTYGDMTPESYLGFIAEIRGFDGPEIRRRIEAVIEKVDIASVLRQPIDTLSKGFKRRVGLAQAMLHDPEILIMDEPTDGLDPNQKHQVRKLIRDMSADRAIIISTHILEEVEAVCSRTVIIAHGRLLADGTPEELLARAPDHNTVMITVDADKADAVKQSLGDIETIKSIKIEKVAGRDGATRLVIRPTKGALIADAVSHLLHTKKIKVQEMYVERGTLDDVFRNITADGNNEAANETGNTAEGGANA
ncbi:MAG: ABC transporter ATP-binding protein [Proteobacteria bacterium]|nr:ABC transporter ATP-binding protein [Pseudomonadota bacterium]